MAFFENPILKRELVGSLRSRKAFVIQLVFLLVLLGTCLLLWPSQGVYSISAHRSRSMLNIFLLGQLAMVVLFSPAFSATSVTSEKERGSYDLLFASLLPPRAIALGKLFSSISFLLLLVISSLPVASLCFLLGGVGLKEMLIGYAILGTTAITYGLLGLAISAATNRSRTAIIITYVTILILAAGTWVPSWILAIWTRGREAIYLLRSVSPFSALLSILQPELVARVGGTVVKGPPCWRTFLLFSAFLGPLLLIIFLVLIRRLPLPKPQKRISLTEDRRFLSHRRFRWPFYLIDPLRRGAMIRDHANPVRVKEMRNKSLARARPMIRGMYILFVFSLCLAGLVISRAGVWNLTAMKTVAVSFQLGLVMLVGPSLTASTITQEKEQGNYELLRMTPLRPITIVMGKLETSTWSLFLLVLATLPMTGMAFFLEHLERGEFQRIFISLGVLLVSVLLATSAGVFASSLSRRTATATVIAYGLVAFLCLGTAMVIPLGNAVSPTLSHWLLIWNPFATSIGVCNATVYQTLPWKESLIALGGLCLLFLVGATIAVRRSQTLGT